MRLEAEAKTYKEKEKQLNQIKKTVLPQATTMQI